MLSQYLWAQPSARRPPAARGGSVITEPRGARRPPARKHAAGPGTGKSGGEPQRPQPRHAPALEPPASRGAYARLSQGPAVSSPPRTSHSESIAGPALGEAPASGPWGFRHHGTSRRQTPTSAQARRRAGNGEERGRTPAPATPPRSRSRAPSKPRGVRPPQPGARGLVAPQNIPQRKHCGPSPRRGARQRPVGVPSSRNLEAPDAHQRASTQQGRERGRAGRTPAPATPPRSRSRASTSRTASSPPQPGARGLVAPQNIPQRKHCGPSPRRGARQRPVGVPSSRNLEAPDAHQRASTPQGRERGRAGANPSARNPATLPL